MELRLQKRYALLVQQHLHAAGPLSAGPGAPLGDNSAFAATQAAWRFWQNERITLPVLIEPLHQLARQWRQQHPTAWALLVQDWSALSYPTHCGKKDRQTQGSPYSQGYELSTLLLVDGRQGDPVVPLELQMRTADALYSTRTPPPDPQASHLDNILPAVQALQKLGLQQRVVHVIDREADSLAHWRAWQAAGRYFLVRVSADRYVRWQGKEFLLAELQSRLLAQKQFRRSRKVTYRGQQAVQQVAEVTVTLDRPAWQRRPCPPGSDRSGAKSQRLPGEPLTMRLVISRVCNARGETLAVWFLFSNVPEEVDAATLALWYYWRWRIESFFKLLKSAGHAVEHWQQETGAAIAKRLLVAAMACALVWQLERAPSSEAISFRQFLVRLSGRQMKYGKSATAPALLAGLWVYLTMLDALTQHSPQELKAMEVHLRMSGSDTG